MSRLVKICNWLAIFFFGLASLVLGMLKPDSPPFFILGLVPYGLMLLAEQLRFHRMVMWPTLVINALWVFLCAVVMVLAMFHAAQKATAILMCVVLAMPSIANFRILFALAYPATESGDSAQIAPDPASSENSNSEPANH